MATFNQQGQNVQTQVNFNPLSLSGVQLLAVKLALGETIKRSEIKDTEQLTTELRKIERHANLTIKQITTRDSEYI